MTGKQPDFRELVGSEDLTPEERDRLEQVHDLLIAAGPPPELPPALAEPSTELDDEPTGLPRRRTGAVLALAAALALAVFLGGYLAGKHGTGSTTVVHSLAMHGTPLARNASATIDIEQLDSSGNWPLRVAIKGLPRLPKGAYYEMFLTKHGKPIAACGIFTVAGSPSTIHLTMPPTVRGYDGWIVTRETPGGNARQVLLTT